MGSRHVQAQRPDDADARFAAYLADMAAGVDDPKHGETYREFLDEDPQTQRAWFDFSEEVIRNPIYNPGPVVAWAAIIAVATAAAIVGVLVMRLLP